MCYFGMATCVVKHPFSLKFKKGQKYEFKIKAQSKIFQLVSLQGSWLNFDPRKNLISMGTSVPGIPSLAYEFYPEESGTHNLAFDKLTNNGKIYTFSNFVDIWDQPITYFIFPSENVILMQLIDDETLHIEQQTDSDGPPWSFKSKYKDFKR